MFYEKIDASFNCKTYYANDSFPLHIHRFYECYAVKKGRVIAVINEKEYTLSAGEAVLVFPYQRHEYMAQEDSELFICSFLPDIVGSFEKNRIGIPVSNKFNFSYYIEKEADTRLLQKSLAYLICGTFDKNAKYIQKIPEKDNLILKILQFVEDNYRNKCTLQDVSKHIGYDYKYISKLFKHMTGQSFNSYVNELRITEARVLLLETDRSINFISESCGFRTVRNFNQKFLENVGVSPRNYRINLKQKHHDDLENAT